MFLGGSLIHGTAAIFRKWFENTIVLQFFSKIEKIALKCDIHAVVRQKQQKKEEECQMYCSTALEQTKPFKKVFVMQYSDTSAKKKTFLCKVQSDKTGKNASYIRFSCSTAAKTTD